MENNEFHEFNEFHDCEGLIKIFSTDLGNDGRQTARSSN